MTKITEKVLKKVEETKEIACDFCGETQKCEPEQGDSFSGGNFGFAFGWGSKFDTDEYVGHICDKCFSKKVLPLFLIPETIKRSQF